MRTVLIIGLGNVGLGYDYSASQSSDRILTHARAFSSHHDFALIGGVDCSRDARTRFESSYKVPSFTSIGEAMQAITPEIVVIATPTADHYASIDKILSLGAPIAILCEKPLAYDLYEAQKIVNLCAQTDCRLFVNYLRISHPTTREIKSRIPFASNSDDIKGVAWYSKGLYNGGSHFINLFEDLLGPSISVSIINKGRIWKSSEPEPDFEVQYTRGRVVFLATKEEHYFHVCAELVTPSGRLRYENGGSRVIWQGLKASDRFDGYVTLSLTEEVLDSDFDRIQWYVADEMSTALNGCSARICTGAAAMKTQLVLEEIRLLNSRPPNIAKYLDGPEGV